MRGHRIIAGLVALVFFYVVSPLIYPITMGGVLAVLFIPWLERLEKRNIPSEIGSALLTLGITSVLILPTSVLVFFTAKTGFYQLETWKSAPGLHASILDTVFHMPRVHHLMEWVTTRVPVEMSQLAGAFGDLARSVGSRLADLLGEALGHLPGMALSLALMVVSIYFFLVDGRKLVLFFRRASVFTPRQTDQLIETAAEMCRSVVLASIVSGGIQALLEGVVCVLTGTPNVAIIGILVFCASFIPLVGSAPVTLGIAIQQLMEGRERAAIVLFGAAIAIVAVDNAVRPLFLKGSTNLHPFLAFIAALGGLQTIGFLGVFLGPIVAALFVVVIQIFLCDEPHYLLGHESSPMSGSRSGNPSGSEPAKNTPVAEK